MKPLFSMFACVTLVSVLSTSCKKTHEKPLDPNKSIDSFYLSNNDNGFLFTTDSIGIIGEDSIILTLPGGTNITHLVPTIVFTGDSISPNNKTAQDFTHPVTYTVIAKNGMARKYIVVVKLVNRNEVIFTNGRVYAIDIGTGVARWINDVTNWNVSIMSAAAVSDNYVFTGTSDGTVYAMDATSGATIWSQPYAHTYYYTPAVSNGIVYIGCADGNIYAFEGKSGLIKWIKNIDQYGLFSTPVILNNNIYIQCNGNLFALDGGSGAILWKSATSGVLNSVPVINNGIAYVAATDSNLYAIDISSGSTNWKSPTGIGYAKPLVYNGVVYTGSTDDSLYAVDATTGQSKWTVFVDNGPSSPSISYPGILSSPIVADNKIIIGGGDANYYAIDPETGSQVWTVPVSNEIISTPSLVNGTIFAGTIDGSFMAINPADGHIKWFISTLNGASSRVPDPSIIAADGTITNP